MPTFTLRNVDGQSFSSDELSGARLSLIVFTCNHCPYVKGSEEQLIALVREFTPQGLRTVTINSNDAAQYPEDSFENMQKKAKSLGLPYPYLYDETQLVARAFDAACTPECYLFDAGGKLIYHGKINDSPKDPTRVTQNYLRTVLEQALGGGVPNPSYVHPLGCSIKWR